jgi:hypothetical protein
MSRTYSDKFILHLRQSDPDNPGIAMGLACVNANLPAKYVADALGVTRMTVFAWFRGNRMRFNMLKKVETFTDLVESDTAKGILPARTRIEALNYLRSMVEANAPADTPVDAPKVDVEIAADPVAPSATATVTEETPTVATVSQ